jgi:hypothetical protein
MRRENYPNLTDHNWRYTSPATGSYNCIAWAANETSRNWWPIEGGFADYYWPPHAPLEPTLEAFVAAFEGLGYEVCESPALEVGFEKVAIYVSDAGQPTHAARQLSSGYWTSKIGGMEDIEHESPEGVESSRYGRAARYLKRPYRVVP